MEDEQYSDLVDRANKGDLISQCNLAARYATGDGVEKSTDLALFWYKRASELGNADATYNIGMMYLLGEVDGENSSSAIEIMRIAADQGSVDASETLAELFSAPNPHIEIDHTKAARYYIMAIYLGSERSIRNMHDMISEGKISIEDIKDALGVLVKCV